MLYVSSQLLPADYCQRERVSDVQRIQTEFVWKSDISFDDKVLGLKATVTDVIHPCHLPKLAVVIDIAQWRSDN